MRLLRRDIAVWEDYLEPLVVLVSVCAAYALAPIDALYGDMDLAGRRWKRRLLERVRRS